MTPRQRVASRYLARTFEINEGQVVWYGKYKNKLGEVTRVSVNEKGDPVVHVRPIPKGRKKDREIPLFRIRKAPESEKKKRQEKTGRTKTASTVTNQSEGGMSRLIPGYPPYGRTREDADGLPLRDVSLLLQTRPAYGSAYTAVPKGDDLSWHLELIRIIEGDKERDIKPSGRVEESLEFIDTRARQAQYKRKTTTPTGNVVYEYSDRQISLRDRKKAKRLEELRKNISNLRQQVKRDLQSKDDRTRQLALAVALLDETYERVGNDLSAANGHYGVTGWLVKHLTLSRGKATFNYVGKSGVKQRKEVVTPAVVSLLRELVKRGKKKTDKLLEIRARDVNAYLKPFKVTAKDLRGFHANHEMVVRLQAVRTESGPLPENRKERKEQLKKEFKKTLEQTAKAVGHEPSTLRSQYLVPGIEDRYVRTGEVDEKMDKRATKTPAEKEDDAVERLMRPAPKKKPPRRDLRKELVEEKDPDKGGPTVEKDPDLSLNYKKVAARYLVRLAAGIRVPDDKKPKEPGDYWQTEEGGWGVFPPGQKQPTSAPDEETAKRMAEGKGREKDKEEKTEKELTPEEKAKLERKRQAEIKARREQAIQEMNEKVRESLDDSGIPPKVYKELQSKMEQMPGGEEKTAKSFTEQLSELSREVDPQKGFTDKAFEAAKKALDWQKQGFPVASPQELGQNMANLVFARVMVNPDIVAGKRIGKMEPSEQGAEERRREAFRQYSSFPSEFRQEAIDQIEAKLNTVREGSPEQAEYEAILDGLSLAAIKAGEQVVSSETGKSLRPSPTYRFRRLVRGLPPNQAEALSGLMRLDYATSPEGRQKVQRTLDEMEPDQVATLVGGEEGDYGPLVKVMDDHDLTPDQREFAARMLKNMVVNETTIGNALIQKAIGGTITRTEELSAIREQIESGLSPAQAAFEAFETGEIQDTSRPFRELERAEKKIDRLWDRAKSLFKKKVTPELRQEVSDIEDEIEDLLSQEDVPAPEAPYSPMELLNRCLDRGKSWEDCQAEIKADMERYRAEKAERIKDAILSASLQTGEARELAQSFADCAKRQDPEEREECGKRLQLAQLRNIHKMTSELYGPPGDTPLSAQLLHILQSGELDELDKRWVSPQDIPEATQTQTLEQIRIDQPEATGTAAVSPVQLLDESREQVRDIRQQVIENVMTDRLPQQTSGQWQPSTEDQIKDLYREFSPEQRQAELEDLQRNLADLNQNVEQVEQEGQQHGWDEERIQQYRQRLTKLRSRVEGWISFLEEQD